jgi:hypothetical protein
VLFVVVERLSGTKEEPSVDPDHSPVEDEA